MENLSSTLIKFPSLSFRKIFDGTDIKAKSFEADSIYNEGRIFSAVLKITDLPFELKNWTGINPREPKTTSGVSNKIKDTLENDPEWFLFKNRGLTLLVDHVTYDNQQGLINIELSNKSIHGLLDGGHTFRVIQEFIETLSDEAKVELGAFVKIEILEGIKDLESAVKIVEARNTSTQVKQQSIEELNKQYEEIKKVLEGKPYADEISYKEYELDEEGSKKVIDVKEILSYIICFDPVNFDDKRHPIKAYSSKAAVVDHFKDHKKELIKTIPLLPDILELRDKIYQELPGAYNHSTNGKFGALTGVLEIKHKHRFVPQILRFARTESTYRIPDSFIYPVLAAFRNLIDNSDTIAKWKTNPLVLFEEVKEDLATRIGEQAKELRNPTKMGKDQATWRSCYDLIQLEVLKRRL